MVWSSMMARKPLMPGEFGAWLLNVRTNYLRWTQEQLAYYAGVPLWLIDGLETGQIQDTDSTKKQQIVKAVEIAYQGPGR
jgi:predicted transcriptional regulator